MKNILFVDFSDVAQRTKNYEEYSIELAKTDPKDLKYLGIAI